MGEGTAGAGRAPAGTAPGSDSRLAIGDLRLVPAPDLRARRRMLDGAPAYLVENPLTRRFFRLDPALHALLARLDGSRTVDEALAAHAADPGAPPLDPEAAKRALAAMLALGLLRLPGRPAAKPTAQPPSAGLWKGLSAILFTRLPLGDLGPLVRRLAPLLGPLFSPPGVAVWALLALAATAAVVAEGRRFAVETLALLSPDLATLAAGALVFVVTKALHEVGHAVAAVRFARAEGLRLTVFPFGLGFMVGMPVPWIDVTGAWAIASRWRRAAIGLAGVYVETWISALAALAWAFAREGALGAWPLKVVLISGASAVLFNLNPLMRLDGYHVLVDLLGTANLAPRARAATGALLRRAFGGGEPLPPRAGALVAYHLAASAWRVMVLVAAFWFAAAAHWAFGVAVAIAVFGLFVARPLVNGAAWLAKGGVQRPARFAAASAAAAGLAAAALLVPLPERIVAEGVAVTEGAAFVYAPSDGRVVVVAPPGPVRAGETVLAVENPEAARLEAQLALEQEAIRLRLREAAGQGPAQIAALNARLAAVAEQRARLAEEIARGRVVADRDSLWQPDRAAALRGAWVRGDDPRPLGLLVPRAAALRLEVALDQREGPRVAETLREGSVFAVRPRHMPEPRFRAELRGPRPEARSTLPSPALGPLGGGRLAADPTDPSATRAAERLFVLDLAPLDPPPLRHGQAVEVRIDLPPAPLAAQTWRSLRQLAQQRLAV